MLVNVKSETIFHPHTSLDQKVQPFMFVGHWYQVILGRILEEIIECCILLDPKGGKDGSVKILE